jgi:hypothetical protein
MCLKSAAGQNSLPPAFDLNSSMNLDIHPPKISILNGRKNISRQLSIILPQCSRISATIYTHNCRESCGTSAVICRLSECSIWQWLFFRNSKLSFSNQLGSALAAEALSVGIVKMAFGTLYYFVIPASSRAFCSRPVIFNSFAHNLR